MDKELIYKSKQWEKLKLETDLKVLIQRLALAEHEYSINQSGRVIFLDKIRSELNREVKAKILEILEND